MEKRRVERVQFFQLCIDQNIQPIWVFGRSDAETIPGLLIDISAEGAQILTNKSQNPAAGYYQLHIHPEGNPVEALRVAKVSHKWSRAEGMLYIRNGFEFDEQVSIRSLLPAKESWFRCELLPVQS